MSSELRTDKLSAFRLLLILLSLVGLQFLFTMHLRMAASVGPDASPEKIEEFNPKLFKIMSFGQLPAVVDWIWIRTLQDPIITHVTKGNHPGIFYTLDLVTDLDPAFMQAYTVGATLVSVIRDDGPGALHLALKGEQFRTKDLPSYTPEFRSRYWDPEWQLPMLLAYIYLFDMEDITHAAESFRAASEIEGSPPFAKALAKRFSEPNGLYNVGARLLAHMYDSTKDPEVKEKIAKKRQWLDIAEYLHGVNLRFEKFLSGSPARKKVDFSDESARESAWKAFQKSTQFGTTDPWGGELSLNEAGKVVTTTPHQKVFGLE